MVNFSPGDLLARWFEADEASLVPHEGDPSPGHGQINEPHWTAALHASDDAAGRTASDETLELDVDLGNRDLVVDAEHSNTIEVDEEQVHEGRVSDHGGLPIRCRRETTDLQGPRPSLTPKSRPTESQNHAHFRRSVLTR